MDTGCFRPVLRMAETPLDLLLSRVRRHRTAELENWDACIAAGWAIASDGARNDGGASRYIAKQGFVSTRDIAQVVMGLIDIDFMKI